MVRRIFVGSWRPPGWPVSSWRAGPAALSGAAPLLLIAYLGWLLFWRPAVVVHDAGVTLENPFRSIDVPWARWCRSTPATR